MSDALEVRGLRKTYDDFTLNDVSFTLPEGSIMGFVGQNGAGKTTTIKLIFNMIGRDGGEIKVLGLDNLRDELAIKQDLAAVFDEIFFVDTWRVAEVEKVVSGFYQNWDHSQYTGYLKQFELASNKKISELSRGMKMKLMLAVAMSHGARLLILDEPTSGLDPVARDELLDILLDYIGDGVKSVFFSTHITSDLDRIADYITLIDHGHIFYTGKKDELLEHFSIVKGGKEDLSDELRHKLIGQSATRDGFIGMLPASEVTGLAADLTIEPPTIDEILVYISKGEAR
ncbi:MAG: ABC transporter ATP-binding protein [Coriobacteriia bacterium]|nr:ABC transporter ATP-binding protein [Coriobacteriia bacterium]